MKGVIFCKVLELGLVGSYSILLVLAARLLLARWERKYSYYLWLAVFWNLVVPFPIQGTFSLIPRQVAEFTVTAETGSTKNVPIPSDAVFIGMGDEKMAETWNTATAESVGSKEEPPVMTESVGSKEELPVMTESVQEKETGLAEGRKAETAEDKTVGLVEGLRVRLAESWKAGMAAGRKRRLALPVLELLWFDGILSIVLFHFLHSIRLKNRISFLKWVAWDKQAGIAEIQGLPAPFLWGIFHPVILLPAGLETEEKTYIICHENCHKQRKDPAIKMTAFIITIIHWFNPLVWLAWILFCRDMEISCDEMVLAQSKGNIRKNYARSLLKYAARQNGYFMTPLTFGEPSVKTRIKNILCFRKRNILMAGLTGAAAAVIALGLAIHPNAEEKPEEYQYYIKSEETQDGEPGIYRYKEETGESRLILSGVYQYLGEDEENLYAEHKEGEWITIDQIRKADGTAEREIIGKKLEADQITSFFVNEDYVVFAAGRIGGSAGLFWGSYYSYDKEDHMLKEMRLTDSKTFTAIGDFIYYQKWWNEGGGENELYRTDPAFSEEIPFGEGLTFLYWDEETGSILASKKGEMENEASSLVRIDPEGRNEQVLFDGKALGWNMESYDKIRFTDLEMGENDIFVTIGQWGYRNGPGWRDVLIRSGRYRIETDGSGYELLSETIKYEETEPDDRNSYEYQHREGYKEAALTFVEPQNSQYYTPGLRDEKTLETFAQQAVRELYDLTGFQIDKAVFECTDLGSFYFARTSEDLEHSRTFYSRAFGQAEGDDIIPSMDIVSARRTWYSDVQQLDTPPKAEKMENGELAVWFLQHSALYQGEEIAKTELVDPSDPEMIKVIMTDDTFYEVTVDRKICGVSNIYGPYPAGAEH